MKVIKKNETQRGELNLPEFTKCCVNGLGVPIQVWLISESALLTTVVNEVEALKHAVLVSKVETT